MLVLTRRTGEAVHIGEDIVVRVLGVKGNQVRLGFDVPKSINVVRDELLKKTPEPAKVD
ncbi:MAG: carbon storage regulator [Alishewanella sp. 34-51-39]|nr:MAG: carbon storage regulator [Alishewanella sp. 34-51-39]